LKALLDPFFSIKAPGEQSTTDNKELGIYILLSQRQVQIHSAGSILLLRTRGFSGFFVVTRERVMYLFEGCILFYVGIELESRIINQNRYWSLCIICISV
jgi:hypothetical protein